MARILRSMAAVIAGVITCVALSVGADALFHAFGPLPPLGEAMSAGQALFALAYRTLFGLFGGYVAARLAPDRPLLHALILGGIGLVVGTAGCIATWNAGPEFGPPWYAIAVAATALPSAWLGGRFIRPAGSSGVS